MIALRQGSPEWVVARLGKVTASRVADVIARTKSGYSASRANYMAQLIAERLTGEPGASVTTPAMQWGIATEPEARRAYEFYADLDVVEVGFVPHATLWESGASPDGFVGAAGLVEFKCPNTATHIETLLSETVPAKYVTQMQWQMACTGRLWCDFVSYDPRLPAALQFYKTRIARDGQFIATVEKEVAGFLTEVEERCARLTSLTVQRRAA